jgi:hypothetical protein
MQEKLSFTPTLLSRTGVGGIPPGWGANGLSASLPCARAQGIEQNDCGAERFCKTSPARTSSVRHTAQAGGKVLLPGLAGRLAS